MPALLDPPPTGSSFPTAAARPAPDWLATLNDAQRAAVDHDNGPLLVLAGAGTGKTATLSARVARLVLDGADPGRVLLLTFSRRAAQEMQRRAGQLLHQALGLRGHQPAPALPWAGTFHSVAARLLARHGATIGLPEAFSILDRADAEELMGLQRQALGMAAAKSRAPLAATCLAIYSRVLNSDAPLTSVLGQAFPWCLGWEAELNALFAAYEQAKQDQGVLDYDDLLLEWATLMDQAEAAALVRARFDHVLVDEYQDTNRLQARLLRGLCPAGRGLTVVGDDAQAIYSFRAAEVRNILEFAGQFQPPARVVTLTQNYRATQPLLDAANAVIALAAEGQAKALWSTRTGGPRPALVSVDDELAQARWVADAVLARREAGLRLKAQAVLFRTGTHSAALELELARRHIPYVKYGGLKFLEAAHIKDLLSLLRWAHNPRGQLALFRALRLLPGVGPATARRLMSSLASAPQPWAALQALPVPAGCAPEDWQGLVQLMLGLQAGGRAGWPAEIDTVVDWYAPHLARLHEHPLPRLADLRQLAALARGHASRERFLAELTLDPPAATSDEAGDPSIDEDYLILSTLHAAKGQEWQAVYLLNLVDGCLPGDLATATPVQLEEERRLLYVGMTRARQQLALMLPLRFHVTQQARHGDRHLYGARSRFIPEALLPLFEAVVPQVPSAEDDLASQAVVPGAMPAAATTATTPPATEAVPPAPGTMAARRRARWEAGSL